METSNDQDAQDPQDPQYPQDPVRHGGLGGLGGLGDLECRVWGVVRVVGLGECWEAFWFQTFWS